MPAVSVLWKRAPRNGLPKKRSPQVRHDRSLGASFTLAGPGSNVSDSLRDANSPTPLPLSRGRRLRRPFDPRDLWLRPATSQPARPGPNSRTSSSLVAFVTPEHHPKFKTATSNDVRAKIRCVTACNKSFGNSSPSALPNPSRTHLRTVVRHAAQHRASQRHDRCSVQWT